MKNVGLALLACLILAGCHNKRTPVTALPPPAPVPIPEAKPTELPAPLNFPQPNPPATPTPAPNNPLDPAETAFNSGNYSEAARRYEKYLQAEPWAAHRDQALFQLALSLVLPANATPDWTRVNMLLKQLVDQYPESPYRPPAAVILSLTADAQKRDQRLRQLTTELNRLKQIDAERRKRP